MSALGKLYVSMPFSEPALNLRKRVTVLLGMVILVAEPGLASRARSCDHEHRIERDEAVAGQTRPRGAAGAECAQKHCRVRVRSFHPAGRAAQGGRTLRGIGRVVKNAG